MRHRFGDDEMAMASRADSQTRLSNSASCRRPTSTTLRPSYGMGMWRAVALLACLTATTQAALFTEGGAVLNGHYDDKPSDRYYDRDQVTKEDVKEYLLGNEKAGKHQPEVDDKYLEYMVEEINRANAGYEPIEPVVNEEFENWVKKSDEQPTPSPIDLKGFQDEFNSFIEMVDEIAAKNKQDPEYMRRVSERMNRMSQKPSALKKSAEAPAQVESQVAAKAPVKAAAQLPSAQKPEPFDLGDLLKGELMLEEEIAKESELKSEMKQAQEKLAKETQAAKVNVESLESAMQTATGEPQVPQKKGQNEFVSFVEPEPQPAKQTVSSQSIDKRRLATSAEYSGNAPRYSSSSLLLLAVGTVMCVGLVGTVAGGTYYYNSRRRTETPDDGEYAPYAGTGPGFRKNKGNKGDETLAYKAQLHQYQQAKQKIICGEDAPGIIESDGEDGADEENNYSVYECPGLAPTGDIEVCNPNFAAQP